MHELTISSPPPIPAILVSRDERGRDPGKAGNKRDGTECRITFFFAANRDSFERYKQVCQVFPRGDQITQSVAGHLKLGRQNKSKREKEERINRIDFCNKMVQQFNFIQHSDTAKSVSGRARARGECNGIRLLHSSKSAKLKVAPFGSGSNHSTMMITFIRGAAASIINIKRHRLSSQHGDFARACAD